MWSIALLELFQFCLYLVFAEMWVLPTSEDGAIWVCPPPLTNEEIRVCSPSQMEKSGCAPPSRQMEKSGCPPPKSLHPHPSNIF